MTYQFDRATPAPKISSGVQSIIDPISTERTTPPMQDPATPTSPEEAGMLEAFSGGSPVPDGNPAAAAAAQELADADTKVAMSGVVQSGRESASDVYGKQRGSLFTR